MALTFPSSPANGDLVILAGRQYEYQSPKWRNSQSVIIDAGFSATVPVITVDGGDADGL